MGSRLSIVRIVRARPRLFVSAAIGALVTAALAAGTDWRQTTRLLVGWDIGVALYLTLATLMMVRSSVAVIRRHAALEDEGQTALLVLTVSAALASVAAIFAELGTSAAAGTHAPNGVTLAGLTILLSWAFVHTIFALHYAHEFYAEDDGGGLAFPGNSRQPDYWDFVYFSFVIGMTSQVSDVAVTSTVIRRTVTAHGIVSFFFNATLLALMVNLAATSI